MDTTLTVSADDFQKTIRDHISLGYRLLMIRPADSPSEALLQCDGEKIRLKSSTKASQTANDDWTVGRAGMMYRDLIPDRLGGKLIASHIRILNGRTVPDSIHYHKIDFQVIYCLKGAVKVVYEDQGQPFWLQPGDCVLQPPEIRHRVLQAEAGSEVIEITSPAEHETWFDHELELPTMRQSPDRFFGNQQFAIHCNGDAIWSELEDGLEAAVTNIGSAGPNAPQVTALRAEQLTNNLVNVTNHNEVTILIEGQGLRLAFTTSS